MKLNWAQTDLATEWNERCLWLKLNGCANCNQTFQYCLLLTLRKRKGQTLISLHFCNVNHNCYSFEVKRFIFLKLNCWLNEFKFLIIYHFDFTFSNSSAPYSSGGELIILYSLLTPAQNQIKDIKVMIKHMISKSFSLGYFAFDLKSGFKLQTGSY